MFLSYGGLFSDEEIIGGIEQAVAIVVGPQFLAPLAAYPAYAFGRDAMANAAPYGGAIPMGVCLALPPGITVGCLGLSPPLGRAIAAAAMFYGLIIVDRGGGGVTFPGAAERADHGRCGPY